MRWVASLIAIACVACADDAQPITSDAGTADADETLVAPATVTAQPGDSEVSLSWAAVPHATRYRVGRATASDGALVTIDTTSLTTAKDSDVTNGVTYYYAVQAMNARSDGPWSATVAVRPVDVLPLAPTGVTAKPGRTKVTLSWQVATDADDYELRRATVSGGPYASLGTVSAPPYFDLGVVDNTTYYYVVVARNTGGASVPSSEVSAQPTDLIPPAPANVAIIPGDGQTTVTWNAAVAATSYVIEYATSQAGPYNFAGIVEGRSFTRDLGAAWYRVTGVGPGGVGDPSASVQRIATGLELRAPAGLTVRPGSDAVTVAWGPVDDATSYTILRATVAGGPYTAVGTSSLERFTDRGLSTGTYYYVVRTANQSSAYSHEVTAVVAPSLPGTPAGLTVDVGDWYVTLTWPAVPGATRYVVRETHTNGVAPHVIAEPTAPSFTHTPYYGDPWERYSVSAVIDDIEGPSTDDVRVDIHTGPPPVTVDVVRTGAERITLVFSGPSSATAHTIYRASGANDAYQPIWTGPTTASTTWHDDAVVAGQVYRYRVRTTVAAGVAWSPEVTAELAPDRLPRPTGLTATAQGFHWARVTWTPVPGATGYTVYASGAGEGPQRRAIVASAEYTDEWAQREPTTTYAVTAFDDRGESSLSDPLVLDLPASPPLAVENVRAEAGDSFVRVTWSIRDAEYFDVERATNPGGPYTSLGIVAGFGFYDTTAQNGQTYEYRVNAVAGGVSTPSPVVSATPMAGPAAPPTVTVRAVGDRAISLAWTEVPAANYYAIYRSTTAGSGYALVTATVRPHFVDNNGLDNDTTYYYTVTAGTYTGEGTPSSEVSGTPTTGKQEPVDLIASSGRDATYLAWSPSPGATSYRIYRSSMWPEYYRAMVPIADVAASPFRDPLPGTHEYAIAAIGPDGESLPSNIHSASAGIGLPPSVDNVTVDTTGGALVVRWSPIGGVAFYDVCSATQPGAPAPTCVTSSRPSAALRGWTPGQQLWISVRVRNTTDTYNFPWYSPSDEVAVTPTAGAPASPTLVAITGNRAIGLEWTAVAGATGYRIWRADAPDQPLAPVAIVNAPYTTQGLVNGTRQTWAVSALGAGTESSWSNEVDTVTGPISTSTTPALTAQSHAGYVTLVVGESIGDIYYQVGFGQTPVGSFETVAHRAERGRLIIAAPSGPRLYRVFTCSSFRGCGSPRYISAAPAPTGLPPPLYTGVLDGNTELTVDWPSVTGATAYRIYRAPATMQGPLEAIAVVAGPPYTDRPLASSQTYLYAVAAIGPDGESAVAPSAFATTRSRHGRAPTNITATAAAGSITVRWDPSPGAQSYEVCHLGNGTVSCESASSPFVDTGLASGTTHRYAVRAHGGALSNAVSATVP